LINGRPFPSPCPQYSIFSCILPDNVSFGYFHITQPFPVFPRLAILGVPPPLPPPPFFACRTRRRVSDLRSAVSAFRGAYNLHPCVGPPFADFKTFFQAIPPPSASLRIFVLSGEHSQNSLSASQYITARDPPKRTFYSGNPAPVRGPLFPLSTPPRISGPFVSCLLHA